MPETIGQVLSNATSSAVNVTFAALVQNCKKHSSSDDTRDTAQICLASSGALTFLATRQRPLDTIKAQATKKAAQKNKGPATTTLELPGSGPPSPLLFAAEWILPSNLLYAIAPFPDRQSVKASQYKYRGKDRSADSVPTGREDHEVHLKARETCVEQTCRTE